MLDRITETVAEAYARNPELYDRIFWSLAGLLLIIVVRRLVLLVVDRAVHDPRARYNWRKTSGYVAFAVAAVVVADIWLAGFARLGTFLGLLSAGVAIALKDPLTNIAGWFFIIWRRPFQVGDRIEIGSRAGDVIDIRIFQFSMLEIGRWVDADQSTGRILHVPNSKVFTDSLANSTIDFPFIWEEVAVLVTFESDWRAARVILRAACERNCSPFVDEARAYLARATRKWFIVYSKLEPIVYTNVRDSGVLLTARFLCPPRQRRSTQDAVWSDVLDGFGGRSDIDFAYPTTRFYDNVAEGKPGAKAAENLPDRKPG